MSEELYRTMKKLLAARENSEDPEVPAGTGVTGSGTVGRIPEWTGVTTLGDSQLAETIAGGVATFTGVFTGNHIFTFNDVNGTVTLGAGQITSVTADDATIANHTHSLNNTGVAAAAYGSATQVATFTVDAKGRLTLAGNTNIAIPLTQITGGVRGDIIRHDGADWTAYNHPGAAGYALTTDANDPVWDQTPLWSGVHTFDAGWTLQTAAVGTVDATSYLSELGIRAALASAEALYVPWQAGDALPTAYFGSNNASNNQNAVYGISYSASGVLGQSVTQYGVTGISSSGFGVFSSSATGTALYANLTGAGAAILRAADNGTTVFEIDDGGFCGIRQAGPSYPLHVPWLAGDATPTAYFGSSNAANTQQAVYAEIYDTNGAVYGKAWGDGQGGSFWSVDGTGVAGSTASSGATDNGVSGNASDAGRGVYGSANSGIGVEGASITGYALIANLTGAGSAIAEFRDNGTPVVHIADGGNVGIGNALTTLAAKLHICGGADASTSGIKLFGSNNDGVRLTAFTHDVDQYGTVYAYDENDGGVGAYAMLRLGRPDGTVVNVDGANSRLGVGRTDPYHLVDIEATNPVLRLQGATNDATGSKIRLTETDNFQGGYLHYDGSANFFHIGVHNSDDTTLGNDVEIINLDRTSTNVYIATTTTAGGSSPALIFPDAGGDPTPGTNTCGFYGKDVSGTTEAFAVDEAGNAAQLTPHNYAGPVQPIPGVLHWSQYHSNEYAGIKKWYDMERALLALEDLTGQQFIFTRRIPRKPKPKNAPQWLRSL